jgi:outer membrane protein OmpA-like peptidoglycan-associated protein
MLHAYLDLPPTTAALPTEKSRSASRTDAPEANAKSGAPDTLEDSKGSFDVARIDPRGTSVFAGRAAPGAAVTIMGDGETIGTAQADANGEWTFATEHPFASADPKLALVVKPASEIAKEATDQTKVAASTERQDALAQKAPQERQSAKAVTSHLLKNLEGMIEAARTTQEQEVAAKAPAPLPAKESAPTSVATADLPPHSEPEVQKAVPVPITFVFNEAVFTDDGKKAAGLLLEYLRLKHFKSVSLTGHADERGTDDLNMGLSRERLETVARFLKEGGFSGELDLVPKGESEPFTGVVRSQYSRDDLFQLDRRVELVVKP